MLGVASHHVEGQVNRGFEAVREAFVENFTADTSSAGRAVCTCTGRESSISGAVFAIRRAARRESRTRWW